MIEGTRKFRGKSQAKAQSDTPETGAGEATTTQAQEPAPTAGADATNLGRREWFRALLPAFGDGLVKLLRESNNLKRDLHETLHENSQRLLASEQEEERRRQSQRESGGGD